MKFRLKSDRAVTVTSIPPGVTVTVRPGEKVTLDGGFDHLKTDPKFETLGDEGKPAGEVDDKSSKAKK